MCYFLSQSRFQLIMSSCSRKSGSGSGQLKGLALLMKSSSQTPSNASSTQSQPQSSQSRTQVPVVSQGSSSMSTSQKPMASDADSDSETEKQVPRSYQLYDLHELNPNSSEIEPPQPKSINTSKYSNFSDLRDAFIKARALCFFFKQLFCIPYSSLNWSMKRTSVCVCRHLTGRQVTQYSRRSSRRARMISTRATGCDTRSLSRSTPAARLPELFSFCSLLSRKPAFGSRRLATSHHIVS